jgi:hypothetical protein
MKNFWNSWPPKASHKALKQGLWYVLHSTPFVFVLINGKAGSYSQTNSRQVEIVFYSGCWLIPNSISGAFSLVPAPAQIFHGRESELKETVAALIQDMARVAIMGPGGMGKTALALAALHHEDVEQRYPHQHFISCESATGAVGLISTVGLYLGLEQSSQLSRAIVEYFQDLGPAILVLDNMETPWEPLSTRTKVEEFLSLLADVSHLALLVGVSRVSLGLT